MKRDLNWRKKERSLFGSKIVWIIIIIFIVICYIYNVLFFTVFVIFLLFLKVFRIEKWKTKNMFQFFVKKHIVIVRINRLVLIEDGG